MCSPGGCSRRAGLRRKTPRPDGDGSGRQLLAGKKRSMAPWMQPSSGLGAFNKIEEGSALSPFPQKTGPNDDHSDDAKRFKFRPWRIRSEFNWKGEQRRKEGEEESGGGDKS